MLKTLCALVSNETRTNPNDEFNVIVEETRRVPKDPGRYQYT